MQTCSGKLPKWSCSSLAGGARRRLLCSGTNIDCRRLPTSPATRFKHIPPQNRLCALNSPGADDELSQCPPQQSVLSRARAQGGCTSCSSHEELEPRGLPAAHHACTQGVRSIVFASALLGLGLNQEAWADEIPAPNSEAFISTTYDPVISIIFGFIVLCLVIVTGGVIYLSFLTYMDERREREEKAKFEQAEKDRKVAALSPKSPVPRAKKSDDTITTRGGGRGFGR